MTTVCLTVDVEDFYDGMAEIGERLERPAQARSGLEGLAQRLEDVSGGATVTLFVVGNYLDRVRTGLERLVAGGHEVGSHGPDHGHLPEEQGKLVAWLRAGREMIEDRVQVPVRGFRSPRFDTPQGLGLDRYREALAQAGFEYVSDRSFLGAGSPVRELPVLHRFGYPMGGGSYQRMLPAAAVDIAVGSSPGPVILYYHSYDFGATLPAASSVRSVALAKQVVGRSRVAGLFARLLEHYGSEACGHVA